MQTQQVPEFTSELPDTKQYQ